MIEQLAKRPFIGLLIIIVLIVLTIPFQNRIDKIRGKFRSVEDTLYMTSSSLKKLSLGYKELFADIYWLRALQYFGGYDKKMSEKDSDLMLHYFDIITDLDPKFVNAYRFGGSFLAEPSPLGFGDIEKGTKLFDKGRLNNPDNFRLPLEEGFLYYLYSENYKKASDLFKEASEKPGLSEFRKYSLRGMAASALQKGGDIYLSRKIWQNIYDNAYSESRKRFALMNLNEINTTIMEKQLTEVLKDYLEEKNRLPEDVNQLVVDGYLSNIPKSPIGGEFIIAKKIGQVKNSELAERRLNFYVRQLTVKAIRFKRFYDKYPEDLAELRNFIETQTTLKFPEHPLGIEYKYDPETGRVSTDPVKVR